MELTFDRITNFMAESCLYETCIHQTDFERVYQSTAQKEGVLIFQRLVQLEEKLKQLNTTYQIVAYTHKRQKQFLVEAILEKEGTVLLLCLNMSYLEMDKCVYYQPMIMDMDQKRFFHLGNHHASIFSDHDLLVERMYEYIENMNECRLHFATNTITLKEEGV